MKTLFNNAEILHKYISIVLLIAVIILPGCTEKSKDSKYLEIVKEYADNVLAKGGDNYGEIHSPLFVDGINVKTGEPVKWEYGEHSWIISNLASQQNLMRLLVGLSTISNDEKYRERARLATNYMFENHTDKQGLLRWGGHQFVDLKTMENHFEGRPHELKSNFPFYKFMWDVDSVATRKMLHGIWNAHVLHWETLDLNRHGEYNSKKGKLWDHEFSQPEPFFEGDGLTFINAGTDMIQVAMALYLLGEEEQAKEWGIRLYNQYVRARNKETGLGVYQYSQPRQKEIPPTKGELRGELTFSKYGDRAQNQFGSKYGEVALEGNVLWGARVQTLYGQSSVMLLNLANELKGTESGEILKKGVVSGLKSFTKYAYDPEENQFKPLWTDGTDLSEDKIPRTGYYGEKGDSFPSVTPDGAMLLSFSKAVHITDGDVQLWDALRNMLIHEGLGDLGEDVHDIKEMNLETNNANVSVLVSLIELYDMTESKNILNLAERIGDNIIEQHFYEGFFRPGKNYIYTKFDTPEPLALLMLEAARQGRLSEIPLYLTGSGSTDGEPITSGGYGRHSDEELYKETY